MRAPKHCLPLTFNLRFIALLVMIGIVIGILIHREAMVNGPDGKSFGIGTPRQVTDSIAGSGNDSNS
jgi:hypothetical protein